MTSADLLLEAFEDGRYCDTCDYLYSLTERGEAWGAKFAARRFYCRLIEDDLEPKRCPYVQSNAEVSGDES